MVELWNLTPEERLAWAKAEQEKSRAAYAGQPKPRISRAKREDYPHLEQVGWAFALRAGSPVRVIDGDDQAPQGVLLGLREVGDGGPLALLLRLPDGSVWATRRADGEEHWALDASRPRASVSDLEVPVSAWRVPADQEVVLAPRSLSRWRLQTNKLEERT